MAEVHVLPGIERRDLAGEEIQPNEILQDAINARLIESIIVGLDPTGKLYIAASSQNIDQTIGLLMRAVTFLTTATIQNNPINQA